MTTYDGDRDRNIAIEMATQAHRALLAALDRLIAADEFDVSAPSQLPGWTKGHVLTHVVNSGDGHCGIFDAAMVGEVRAQYPHGAEGRAADIEAGAARPADVQRDALRASIWRLEACWARAFDAGSAGSGIAPDGTVIPLGDLPFYRMREVAIHHIDLDIGRAFADLPGDYVERDVAGLTRAWSARHPDARGLPPPVAALVPHERLAWLLGRISVHGVAPAALL